jgi:cytochrome c-type biogenesis protein CcmE
LACRFALSVHALFRVRSARSRLQAIDTRRDRGKRDAQEAATARSVGLRHRPRVGRSADPVGVQRQLVFFVSPSDLAKSGSSGRQVLGGLVEQGTVEKSSGGQAGARLRVTDGNASILVTFTGILPDLFREGQGVVVLGAEADGVFQASEVLAKHDETYMPKEVAEALKKSGRWNPGFRSAAAGRHLESAKAARVT